VKIKDLHPTTRKLLYTRAFRSVGQGALIVDLALYLKALGWNGFHIGLVLSVGGLLGALLSLSVGIASDHLKRRPFLLAYESLVLICSILALLTSQAFVLTIVIIVAGFGRGGSGAAGPSSPVEQAWLAEEVQPTRRGRVYSMNRFFGTGCGALLAMLPVFLNNWIEEGNASTAIHSAAYRPLFFDCCLRYYC
jgi:MFS family permease